MSRNIEEILNECLEAILHGESVESCLAKYPEHAKDLEPLLRIAFAGSKSSSTDPHPELKSETKRSLEAFSDDPQTQSQLEEAFGHCLDLLLEGHSIQQCLARYPQYSSVLGPLLQITVALQRTFELKARPEFKEATRQRLSSQVAKRKPRGFLAWLPSLKWTYPKTVALAAVVVVVIVGASAIKASSDSKPDDLLYPVKEFTEDVQMVMATSNSEEAELHLELADRRTHEMVAMVQEGDLDKANSLAQEVSDHLERVSELVEDQQRKAAIKMMFGEETEPGTGLQFQEVRVLRTSLDQDFRTNDAMLKAVFNGLPIEEQYMVEDSFQDIKKQHDMAIQTLEFKQPVDDMNLSEGQGLAFFSPKLPVREVPDAASLTLPTQPRHSERREESCQD